MRQHFIEMMLHEQWTSDTEWPIELWFNCRRSGTVSADRLGEALWACIEEIVEL